MTTKACTSCLRTLQRQSNSAAYIRQTSRCTQTRAFRATANQYAALPPNATQTTSIPPVTPIVAKGEAALPAGSPQQTKLGKISRNFTETYTAYGATEIMFKDCAKHADYKIPTPTEDEEVPKTAEGEDLGVGEGSWHQELGLPATFSTWSQVTMLHMYLLTARFRCFEASASKTWQQHLLDHFFYDAENRMAVHHNMHARGTRNKYLKDLFVQWRGLLAAYDEGLIKGDAVLASAVWRNIFKASEDVDVRHLATIVAYMRDALQALDRMPEAEVQQVAYKFGSLNLQAPVVKITSPMMKEPFEQATVSKTR